MFGGDSFFFFQAEDGIRDLVRSPGLGDVYKRQGVTFAADAAGVPTSARIYAELVYPHFHGDTVHFLSLIHI